LLIGRRRGAIHRGGGRPTIKMIAGLAGVATSTVSRALNEDRSISDATRRRIARIAARVGFVPNAAARGLVTRRSSVVALILGLSPNPFYLEMIPVISMRLAARGMGLMIFRMGDQDRIEDTLGALARHHVGGCLVAAASLTREAARLCSRFNIPIVMINRLDELQASSVNCDNRDAGRQVAQLLLQEGRRRLAYVGGEPGGATFQDAEREAGFREALQAAGATAPRRYAGSYSYDGGLAVADALGAEGPAQRPDGVFVANDIMAFGVIDGLRRAGVEIPRDTSLVGFDDLPQARWIGYDLTTVRQPIEALVTAALEILERRVADLAAPAESVFVGAELVQRGTTR
jgi:DNA-binding LacI/PurR family transcriptional regulator